MTNQNRPQFREQVFDRDDHECLVPWCSHEAEDAHHILERELWSDGGYIPDNGASVCNHHHQHAETNDIPPQALWMWAGIEAPPLPEAVDSWQVDKWGNSFESPPHEDLRDRIKYQSSRHLLPLYWHDDETVAKERMEHDDTGLETIDDFVGVPLVVTHKIDGCLPYNQQVLTKEQGAVPIGTLVNQELDVSVKSYNFETGDIEYRPVTNYYRNGKTDNWLRIEHDGRYSSRLVVTPNHEIYQPDGSTVLAGDLQVGDEFVTSRLSLSQDQTELVYGSMLGDASLSNGGVDEDTTNKSYLVSETHSAEKQGDYVEWKAKIWGQVASNISTHWSRYDEDHRKTKKKELTTKALPEFDELRDFIPESDYGRTVPDWLELTPKTIAVWYCDDGSCPETPLQRPRAQFHTHGFSADDCEVLLGKLSEYGITGRVADYGKGPRIEVSADGTEALFETIAKHIPDCMRSKVPELYWESECKWEMSNGGLATVEIQRITHAEPMSPVKFDIEVEGNHNYFTSEILVSNSNCMVVSDVDNPVRARNGSRPEKKGTMRPLYRDGGLYWKQEVHQKLPDRLQVFGEWVWAKHSIHYGCECDEECEDVGPYLSDLVGVEDDRAYFQVFGVHDTELNLWLSWPETEHVADTLGFPTVPVIHCEDDADGATFETPHEARTELISYARRVIDNGGEGIVVRKKFPFHYGQFGRSLGKYVRENHVEKDAEHWSMRPTVKNLVSPSDR